SLPVRWAAAVRSWLRCAASSPTALARSGQPRQSTTNSYTSPEKCFMERPCKLPCGQRRRTNTSRLGEGIAGRNRLIGGYDLVRGSLGRPDVQRSRRNGDRSCLRTAAGHFHGLGEVPALQAVCAILAELGDAGDR